MAEATIGVEETPPLSAPLSAVYRNYALFLLLLIYTVNFIDRQILSSIGESIKNELNLTDTQMGALGGIFFAFVYTVLGIPIARWADRGNRPMIMTLSLALWSGFTVLSSYARNFGVLAFARAGVGIGEAGCSPTAHSLLADYFPKDKRATALAIYSMGISIGTLGAFALGGYFAQVYGWRAAFLIAGLPGLFFAVIALFTLREPRKQMSRDARTLHNAANHISLHAVFSTLFHRPTFWLFALGGALVSFVSYAHSQYLQPFFLRNHMAELTELATRFHMAPEPGKPPIFFAGLALGLASGIGGAFGSWMGGVIADHQATRNIRNYAIFPLLIPFLTIPVLAYVISTDNVLLALFLLLIPNIGVGAWWGPVYGGVQGLVPVPMRALSAAVLLFVINIIGLGGGPTSFGIVTDVMQKHYLAAQNLDPAACKAAAGALKATCAVASAHAIKTTMYLSILVLPVAMLCFFISRWTITKDMDRAEIASAPVSTRRLAAFLAFGCAIPGFFLGNASALFFPSAPHGGVWGPGMLAGTLIGGLVGLGLAASFVASGRRQRA